MSSSPLISDHPYVSPNAIDPHLPCHSSAQPSNEPISYVPCGFALVLVHTLYLDTSFVVPTFLSVLVIFINGHVMKTKSRSKNLVALSSILIVSYTIINYKLKHIHMTMQ